MCASDIGPSHGTIYPPADNDSLKRDLLLYKLASKDIWEIRFLVMLFILTVLEKRYSKTPQSADFGTEQNYYTDFEIRRLRVLLYVVNGTEWYITEC